MRLHTQWIIGAALGALVAGVIAAAAPLFASQPADHDASWAQAAAAAAQDPGALAQVRPGPGPDLRRRLNLSEDQARRVDQIVSAYRARAARLRIDLARARLDAREALLEATPDRNRLDAIARRIGDLQGQLARARFEMLAELKGVLTPEQWMRLQTLYWGRGLRRPWR
jgi:Spy/CpxP family protein refolding chaperone